MLPAPVSFRAGRRLRISHPQRKTWDILLTRARVTNLGLLALAFVAGLSLLLNLWYLISSSNGPSYSLLSNMVSPHALLKTIDRDKSLRALDHLVMVPGHAIWTGSNNEHVLDENNWILEPYQKGGGRVAAFYNHIARGVDITLNDERSLLMFSGGQTRRMSTTTEAESYMRLALGGGLLPSSPSTPFIRATTEDSALDSFQNLLFSIVRFHEYTGHYPTKITVVGYEMKRRRFVDLHRAALRWPESQFKYIGIDAEGEKPDELTKARDGERKNGYLPYSTDMYGCHELLLSKRRSRNPFIRFHSYYTSSPELAPLLNWCPGPAEGGQTAIYKGPLPWDHLH